MTTETKKWVVEYSHSDGRSGKLTVTTEIGESGGFQYGNGKGGALIIDGYPYGYDLRYNTERNLHLVMIKDYFGKGLVKATEI